MDLKGCWVSNPRNGRVTREKLDRILVNWNWRSCFQHASAIALPIISSDHSPLIFHLCPNDTSGRCFKYEAYWDEHPDCKEEVRRGWERGARMDSAWEDLLSRTKAYKSNLQRWNKAVFRRADGEIARLKGQLNV